MSRAVWSPSCSSHWPLLSLNFLSVFWKRRLSSDRSPSSRDLWEIYPGFLRAVSLPLLVSRLIYWSLYGRWLFLAGGCCWFPAGWRWEVDWVASNGTAGPRHFRIERPPEFGGCVLMRCPQGFHLINFLSLLLFVSSCFLSVLTVVFRSRNVCFISCRGLVSGNDLDSTFKSDSAPWTSVLHVSLKCHKWALTWTVEG